MFSNIGDLVITGPSLDDQNAEATYDVAGDFVKQLAVHLRRQPLLDFWALVKGTSPPVNNIGYHEGEGYDCPDLTGLKGATALFRGIERPHAANANGNDIYVFICPHKFMYRLIADMVCPAKHAPSPNNAVFACYVRRYEADAQHGTCGMILAWEWVKSDDTEPNLPNDWEDRYETTVWRRL